VKILERVRRIRTAFEAAITDDFVRVRAQGGLTAIVAGIGAGSFPDTTADTTAKDLDGIVTWIDSTQQKAVYWRDLSRAIAKLSAEVRVETISDLNAQVELQKLLTELGKQPQDNLEAMTALEAQYAWLKILWERRSNPEFDSLIQLRKRSASVAMLFGAADDAAWVRLQKAVEQKTLILVPPTSVTGEPLQAYDALTFKLETDDPTLGATYLFLHRLEFRWTFELTPASSKGRKGGAIRLTPKTTEPQVVQYAPTPGLLKAQVDIVRNGISLKGPEAETRIGRSSDFDIWKIAERADVIAFGLAGAAAIVSGMFMHYTKTPTFGSPSDYLSLAVWGAGMDQGKNLLMASQTYSSAQKP
jgi:hypothetical protein